MPTFKFEAMDSTGSEVKDQVDALSEDEAQQKIRQMGYFVTKITEVAGKKDKKKAAVKKRKRGQTFTIGGVSSKQLTTFTRQFSTLQDAGLPVLRSLKILEHQMKPGVLKNSLIDVVDDIEGGSTLSEAFGKHPKCFDRLYVNMVKAGELGGVLEVVLVRLAEYQEKAHKLKNKIVSAMVYPVIVMFIAVAILVFLMLFIVPKFETMFAELGKDAELPMISQIVFGTSKFFLKPSIWIIPNIVWVLLAFVGDLPFADDDFPASADALAVERAP